MNLQLKEYQKSLLPVEEPETPDVTPAVPADPRARSWTPPPSPPIWPSAARRGGVGQHPHHFGEIRKIRRLPGRHPGGGERSWRQGTAPWRSRPAAAPAMSTAERPCGRAGGGGAGSAGRRGTPFLWTGGAERRLLSYGVLRQLGRAALNSAYVTLDDSRQTADVLPALLRQLNYRDVVSTPMETNCERVDLARPGAPSGDRARVARLTRHLKARLEDFGPGGPQVTGGG